MIVVVDASAAVALALRSAESTRFSTVLETAEVVLAPDIYPSEVTNVFWKYARFSGIPQEECERAIEYCIDLIEEYVATRDLIYEVFSESMRYEHSCYDMFYLIAARRNGAHLITKDTKLTTTAGKMGIPVN